MINHSQKNNQIHVAIAKTDFSYRIPAEKIASIVTWKIGEKGNEEMIVFKNVSKWMLKLFTKNITDDNYIQDFKEIITEYAPKNNIDWKETLLAVKVQNRYNWLTSNNTKASDKVSETDILMAVKEKYKLDY